MERIQTIFNIVLLLVVMLISKKFIDSSQQVDQLQQENLELRATIQDERGYIDSLQQSIYELNKLSEQYEAERDAINTKYAKLRKQLPQALSTSPCAYEPLPDNVVDILRQFNSTTTITEP